jgi:hypothetical protein
MDGHETFDLQLGVVFDLGSPNMGNATLDFFWANVVRSSNYTWGNVVMFLANYTKITRCKICTPMNFLLFV